MNIRQINFVGVCYAQDEFCQIFNVRTYIYSSLGSGIFSIQRALKAIEKQIKTYYHKSVVECRIICMHLINFSNLHVVFLIYANEATQTLK